MEDNFNSMNMEDISKLFYEMLEKKEKDEDNMCYISGEPLDSEYITLLCNHKFNYIHIYNEICSQKLKTYGFNRIKLKVNQLQCPYCRNIQDEILPSKCNLAKTHGVNCPETYTMKPNTCSYTLKSGSNKGMSCKNACYYEYCNRHMKYLYKSSIVNDTCKAIIKSGKNKGNNCSCKVFENGYCKRHNK